MSFNKNIGMYEGFIYRITNIINGKQYIGQTTQSVDFRWKQHQYRSTVEKYSQYLYMSLRKYGINKFKVETIDSINNLSHDDLKGNLDELEIQYIKKYNTYYPNGYNLTRGGDFNPTYLISKKIVALDRNNNIVEQFDSIKLAENKLNITWYAISKCCKFHEINKKYSYHFYYLDEYLDCIEQNNAIYCDFFKKTRYSKRTISTEPRYYQFDKDYNILNKYVSMQEASDKSKIGYSVVSHSCNNLEILDKYDSGFCRISDYSLIVSKQKTFSFYTNEPNKFTKPYVPKLKPIFQFANDGTMIRKYSSIKEVCSVNNYTKSNIHSAIYGSTCSAYNYLWSYQNTVSAGIPRYDKTSHPIFQLDENNQVIQHYKSIKTASDTVGVSATSISCACRGITNHSAGFKWAYA